MKKLCEYHFISLWHTNLQYVYLRIELIFSQNVPILMVKSDVKDNF